MSSSGVLDIPEQAGGAAAGEVSSERVLLSRLRRGEPDAFEALVREHQNRVYDFCVRMLGDREEAHDLVQEIFVSVHQNLSKFREDAKLSTWIFRISKNQCINRLKYLKRRGRGRSDEYGDVGEDALSDAMGAPPTPDAALESSRERARVQWAIGQLEPDARMLVALRDIEGLSYEEIIQITELPEGTVKSRLHRAREKLAELLGQLEE